MKIFCFGKIFTVRYNCYSCDFDLCSDCITRILRSSQRSSEQVSLEDEAPRVRKISRRVYSKSEIGIQTSSENINRNTQITETKFAS